MLVDEILIAISCKIVSIQNTNQQISKTCSAQLMCPTILMMSAPMGKRPLFDHPAEIQDLIVAYVGMGEGQDIINFLSISQDCFQYRKQLKPSLVRAAESASWCRREQDITWGQYLSFLKHRTHCTVEDIAVWESQPEVYCCLECEFHVAIN